MMIRLARRTFNRYKYFKQRDEIEFSDDSDEGDTKGDIGTPLDPPTPGVFNKWPEVPNRVFYDLIGQHTPRNVQPAYLRFPLNNQLWHLFNANAIPLGRLSNEVSQYLTGKHRPFYNHSMLSPDEEGDFVIVVNGKFPLLYGNKGYDKVYRSHSRYPGGLKELDIRHVLRNYHWNQVVIKAVSGMLPKNKLKKDYLSRLFVYPDLYHDKNDLPQFQMKKGIDHSKELGLDTLFDDPDTRIVYASDLENLPEKVAHIPVELSEEFNIEVPFGMREKTPRLFNKTEYNQYKRFMKKMKRYRVFNYETKKFEIR